MISIGNPYNWKLLHSKCNWTEESLENFMQIFDKYYAKEEFKETLYNIIDYGLPFNQEELENNYEYPNISMKKEFINFSKEKQKIIHKHSTN